MSAGSVAQPTSEKALVELDNAIKAIAQEDAFPSVAYALLRPGRAPHMQVLGFANTDSRKPATTQTRYRIASISKMLVSIAIMQLAESGDLSLSDPVARLLPEVAMSNRWAETHPVRIVHLLESTTGWDEISMAEFAYQNDPPLSLAASLAVNPGSRESRWPPGTRHAYTNSAAAVAAHIIESTTGLRFEDYIQQRIFGPLGMLHASYDKPYADAATGYQNGIPVPHKPILMRPAGSVSASLQDMTKLTQLYLNRGKPLLSPASVLRMEQSQSTNAGPFRAGYGLNNFARYYDGWRYRGHDGALPGWLSELAYSPEQGVGFVVLHNSEQPRSFRRIVNLITSFLATQYEKPVTQSLPVPEVWQSKAGYYRYINPRVAKRYFLERLTAAYHLSIDADGAHLRSLFPPSWQRALSYDTEGQWRNDKGEPVMVHADDPLAGPVLHYGDRVFRKVSFASAWGDKVVLLAWMLCLVPVLLYSLIWPFHWLKGKIGTPAVLRAHVATTAAGLGALCFLLFLGTGLASPIERLGQIGLVSIGLMLSSILFALVTIWACWQLFRRRDAQVRPVLYYYCTVFLCLQGSIVIYLVWQGVIGIRAWT